MSKHTLLAHSLTLVILSCMSFSACTPQAPVPNQPSSAVTLSPFTSHSPTQIATTPMSTLISTPASHIVFTPSATAEISQRPAAPTSTATPTPKPSPPPPPLKEEQKIPVIFQPDESVLVEGVTWQEYRGQFHAKDRLIGYSLSYPAGWFIYPELAVGSVQIQNFSREEMLERGITNMGGPFQVKIQVDYAPPCEGSECSQFPGGEPIFLAGLSGKTWVEYDEFFNLTTQKVLLPIENNGGALQITIHITTEPNAVPAETKKIIDYLLFSLKVK